MRVEVAGVTLLDGFGDSAVDAALASAREPVDDGGAHDVVCEPEAQRAGFDDETRRDRFVERSEHRVLVEATGGDDDIEIEIWSDHRGQLERRSRGFRQ